MSDKEALKGSSAGMRLIALVTLYNGGVTERFAQFMGDSLHADLVAEKPVEARVAEFTQLRVQLGKLRVRQVIASAKEHVLVLLAGETGPDALFEVRVEEDYPHAITLLGVNVIDAPQTP